MDRDVLQAAAVTTDGPTLLVALQKHAAATPDALAVRDDRGEWSYAAFAEAVDRRGEALAVAGVGHRDRVAVVADNSAAYLVNVASIWRVGAIVVTVFASSGQGELEYCLTRSDPVLVLASDHLMEGVTVAASGRPVAPIDPDSAVPSVPAARTRSDDAQSDLALICFTSGSTSRPKAVMHTHGGLTAAAHTFAAIWHISPADRTIVCLPMAWAFGLVTTSITTLIAGGVVLALARARPDDIWKAVVAENATFLAGVTSIFTKLVDHIDALGPTVDHSLRLCISGGEPRNEAVFDRWLALTEIPVHDNYAASECFPVITYDPRIDPAPKHRSAGKLVPGAQMRVVDQGDREVVPGELGEALWKAPAQFVGYWRDDEQTTKATTPDGWYRTSDLVRVDPDGYVFVEGRLGDMIIRGGSNVSPAEVESVLRLHPSVTDAAVVGIPDPKLGQRVVAVVTAPDPSFAREQLVAHCREHLAAYKIPSEFVAVESLPINDSTGKVDRKRVASLIRLDAGPSSIATP